MNVFTVFVFIALAVTASGEVSSRIIGGSDVAENELPWLGSLQIHNGDDWIHFCGVALYTDRKALTAAHCLYNNPSSYRVMFGVRNNTGGINEQISAVESYSVNPGYSHNLDGFPNDTAVVRLSTSIDISGPAVRTIALASDTSAEVVGSSCMVAGWGKVAATGGLSDILQKVNVTLISNTQCGQLWAAANVTGAAIYNDHLCTYENGSPTTICNGDTGGPLVCGNHAVGVVSWGLSSCSGQAPTVYARVSTAYSWITGQ